jgi:hypothetical protein
VDDVGFDDEMSLDHTCGSSCGNSNRHYRAQLGRGWSLLTPDNHLVALLLSGSALSGLRSGL